MLEGREEGLGRRADSFLGESEANTLRVHGKFGLLHVSVLIQ